MRLYSELAAWWPLLDDPADYAEEAGVYGDLLAEACDAPIESLLELGSGGGNSASHLKGRFPRLVLADLSEDMLAVSRILNPECEHRLGDMRTLRLGRTFDAVFVHDAVCYMTTEEDLRRAMETAWVHCRPGGAVLFAPDYVRENFRAGETAGGCDERPPSGAASACPRGLRYLEWVWDPEPMDTAYLVAFAFRLRERDG
ncbi:MAG: class I SAM-dependent methyltransferase, partial [Chloroflexi bacterium]|nr:class I SAM-dependent methyltransferase [Chloroflexota bacterium]